MSLSFAAQVAAFSEKARRNASLVLREAAQTTFEAMTRRQPSASETGGSFEVGKVPVDTGSLIGTSYLAVNGQRIGSGKVAKAQSTPPDFALGLAGVEVGDEIMAGFTAAYARAVEYGHGAVEGRFFVREAAAGWQRAVDAAAAKFKD